MSVSSVDRPASALRQRMLDDMAMRGLRSDTQRDYIRVVRSFAVFLGRSPDTAQAEDIRRFQVHQHESGVQPPTINCSVSALRFFFTVTLDRPDLSRRLVLARYPLKLPAVLNVEEVGRLLEAAPGPKYKAILGTAYGAGLRVSEVASLKVDDIDSKRMLIRVEQGKGRKDRNAMRRELQCSRGNLARLKCYGTARSHVTAQLWATTIPTNGEVQGLGPWRGLGQRPNLPLPQRQMVWAPDYNSTTAPIPRSGFVHGSKAGSRPVSPLPCPVRLPFFGVFSGP